MGRGGTSPRAFYELALTFNMQCDYDANAPITNDLGALVWNCWIQDTGRHFRGPTHLVIAQWIGDGSHCRPEHCSNLVNCTTTGLHSHVSQVLSSVSALAEITGQYLESVDLG